jgi:hypothetical protein
MYFRRLFRTREDGRGKAGEPVDQGDIKMAIK